MTGKTASDIEEVSYIWLDCLWCDQGMAHVLRVFDAEVFGEGGPDALAVFDFGAEQMFKSKVLREAQAAPAVETLMEYLDEMETARIEYFVVSHQDTDHWSLVKYLLDEVDEQDMDLEIGKVIYGGDEWGDNARRQVNRLGEKTANPARDVIAQTRTYSDYAALGPTSILGSIGDLYIRTLVVNAPTPAHGTGAMRKNGTSAVTTIEFDHLHFVLPGDATWETLAYANTILERWVGGSPLASTFMMSVPHHGAFATLTHGTTELNGFNLVRQFVDFCPANSTVASAGSSNRYSHPYLGVIEAFSAHVGTHGLPGGQHNFVAYDPDEDDWVQQADTWRNIYTTVLTHDTNPIYVANWSFYVEKGGLRGTVFKRFEGATRATLGVDPMDEDEAEEQWWDNYEDDELATFVAEAQRVLPAHFFATLPKGAELFSYQLPGQAEVVRPLNRRMGRKKTRGVKRVIARARPGGRGT